MDVAWPELSLLLQSAPKYNSKRTIRASSCLAASCKANVPASCEGSKANLAEGIKDWACHAKTKATLAFVQRHRANLDPKIP